MRVIVYQASDTSALSKNFTRKDFKCPCGCTRQMVDSELVEKLQAIRDKLGKAIKVNRSINPVALGIIAAQYFKAVGIYWYDGCAIVHTDTRDAKATWLCDAPRHYPSTTYQKFILPTIRRGCTGDANRAATKMLQRLLGLTPDGIFGEDTENALLKAQEAHGLTVDGICGPASWKAISGASKYL